MHRIQKYQVGGGINVDWAKMLNLPSISPTSPSDTIQKAGNFLASTLANSGSKVVPDISKMAGLLKPGGLKDLGNVIGGGFNNLLGQGGSNVLKGLKGFTGMNPGQITGIAGDLAGIGLEALGVRKMDSKGANAFDKGLDFASKAVGMVPGVGWVASAALQGANLLNKYAGKTAKELGTEDMNLTGYNLSTSSMANTKFGFSDTVKGWFGTSGKESADRTTSTANKFNLLAGNIGYQQNQNQLAANNSLYHIGSRNQQQLYGGVGTRLVAAQKGTKLPKLFKNGGIAQKNNLKSIILKAQKGAKLIVSKDDRQVNVIPEGAFHSRKNNLPTEISEQVTPKGIPVVSEEEGGILKQHAEIEKNEIIFHKEATETIEELLEKYSNAKDQKEKDAIAIKCGKYITKEILVNTDDRTGLIDSIK